MLIGSFSFGALEIFFGQLEVMDGHKNIGGLQQVLWCNILRVVNSRFGESKSHLLARLRQPAFTCKQSRQRQARFHGISSHNIQGSGKALHSGLAITQRQQRIASGEEDAV